LKRTALFFSFLLALAAAACEQAPETESPRAQGASESGAGGHASDESGAEGGGAGVEEAIGESGGAAESADSEPCAKLERPATVGEELWLRNSVREFVEARAREGFKPVEEVERLAVIALADEWPARRVGPVAHRETPLAYERHAAEELTWEAATDCDRLDAAFAELESRGIIARQNFMDCAECAFDEVQSLMWKLREQGRKVRGYVFYHEEDTAQAARGEGLALSYGAIDKADRKWVAIGRQVAAALNRHGLTATWSGDSNDRVTIENIVWRKRRSTSPPAADARGKN